MKTTLNQLYTKIFLSLYPLPILTRETIVTFSLHKQPHHYTTSYKCILNFEYIQQLNESHVVKNVGPSLVIFSTLTWKMSRSLSTFRTIFSVGLTNMTLIRALPLNFFSFMNNWISKQNLFGFLPQEGNFPLVPQYHKSQGPFLIDIFPNYISKYFEKGFEFYMLIYVFFWSER